MIYVEQKFKPNLVIARSFDEGVPVWRQKPITDETLSVKTTAKKKMKNFHDKVKHLVKKRKST